MTRLEDQALVPMYGEHPIELGMSRTDTWLDTVKHDARYQALVRAAFGDFGEAGTRDNLVKALTSFERSIVSARSPYDRYHYDRDDSAISEAARRGEMLFHSRPLSCFMCHGGANFSDAMSGSRRPTMEFVFHNTGLYNLAGSLSFPAPDTGIHELTHDPKDVGKFKAPTLRNIAVTAPYMHDGSIPTLAKVIEHYAAGAPPLLKGFSISAAETGDLIAFLQSLTDEEFLANPAFGDPHIK
jgi:cytochrome c peroxidase